MFKLNFKIALRNLWKNKTYAAINIFGLAAGLSGFLIILLYINYETGFDKWDPVLERTYQVGLHRIKNESDVKIPEVNGYFVEMVRKKFPEVAHISMGFWPNKRTSSYLYKNKKVEIEFSSASIDDEFLKLYPIKAAQGKFEDVFKGKDGIAISLTKAKEIFGNEDPINKSLVRLGGANFKDQALVVKAVWDDQKYKSYYGLDFLAAVDFEMFGDEKLSSNYNIMLQVNEGVNLAQLTQRINDQFLQDQAKRALNNSDANFTMSTAKAKEVLNKQEGISSQKIIIEPVTELNLKSYFSANSKQTSIYILTALATFLVIISCINFTNLAIVQATGRAKEVGIKKVLGAFRFNLTTQFLAETAMQCLASFLVALIGAELLLPLINNTLDTKLTLLANTQLPVFLMQLVGVLVIIVLLAGLYPAMFLSAFLPAKVLKGNFSTSFGAITLRKSLMVLQFTIAGALVICFLTMENQLNYMKNKDLGMQANQIMVLGIGEFKHRNLNPEQFSGIAQRLKNIKGVMEVSRSTDGLVGEGGWNKDFSYNAKTVRVNTRYNDINYLEIINAKILSGRNFSNKFIATDTLKNVVINETAVRAMGLKNGVGDIISVKEDDGATQFNVIGVVKDIQNEGFDKAIKPTIYLASDYQWHWRKTILLSLTHQDIGETIEEVKKTWKEIEADSEPAYSFADQKFAKLNATYERMAKIMFSFSALTLMVSILGLFSLAAYSAKIRIKEIAIRKILGASTLAILRLLNTDLVKLIIAANIFADVLAYIYMNSWFETFVYRIDMPLLPFLSVNIGTILITILTVSFQSLRSVNANPVIALKYE